MADWGGIIGSALSGGGRAAADIADGMIKNDREIELAKERDKIVEQRELRLNEMREKTRRDGNAYDFTQLQSQAPARDQMAVNTENTVGAAKSARVAADKATERDASLKFETDNIGAASSNARKMAQAKDIDHDAEGRAVRNQMTQAQIDDREEIRTERKSRSVIMDEYSAALDRDDKPGADKAQKKLAAHNRKFGRDDTKDWVLKKDEENGGYFEYNQKTADIRKVDTANIPTRGGAGGAPKAATPADVANLKAQGHKQFTDPQGVVRAIK